MAAASEEGVGDVQHVGGGKFHDRLRGQDHRRILFTPRLLGANDPVATDLEGLRIRLTTVDGLIGIKGPRVSRLAGDSEDALQYLQGLTEKIAAIPDQTTAPDAQTFLTTAQLRLADYREAMRKNKAVEISAIAAKTSYDACYIVLEE